MSGQEQGGRIIDAAVIRADSGMIGFVDEPIDRLLRQSCGGKDRALVDLEQGEPTGEIGSVVGARFQRNGNVRAEKCRSDLGNLSEQSSCLSR